MSHPIEFHGVTQRFRDVTAVDDLTVTLEGGQIHGLLGRNGSGKTTMLSIAAAYRKPTAGEVKIGGQPVWENPAITQDVCLIRGSGDTIEHDWPEDRVKDAIAVAAAMWPRWDADYAAELLDRFELDPDQHLPQLSRGQRSTVGVILGLASRAPVTMLDESYLGMDAPSRYLFYDALLADFLDHPRTIVISTHLIEEVSKLFDHITMIDAGGLLLHDDAEALRGRGVELTGPADAVDQLIDGRVTVLSERRLGATKAVTLYGELDADMRERAVEAGLELGPIALQDLFVHLTASKGGR